ncbi:hypothetical protein GCM10023224_04850 [Streptomonospora halophila]|uniref:Uncharacterized protein n=1 Tax=Streptomonospora halophila TaxID=427369 RepID=A0ABP9G6L9_9ACTN
MEDREQDMRHTVPTAEDRPPGLLADLMGPLIAAFRRRREVPEAADRTIEWDWKGDDGPDGQVSDQQQP